MICLVDELLLILDYGVCFVVDCFYVLLSGFVLFKAFCS